MLGEVARFQQNLESVALNFLLYMNQVTKISVLFAFVDNQHVYLLQTEGKSTSEELATLHNV